MTMRTALYSLFLLAASPAAHAAFQRPPVVAPTPAAAEQPKRWAAEFEARYTGSFLNFDEPDRKSSFSLISKVAYKHSEKLSFQGVWGINQILEPEADFQFTNPEFRMFYRLFGRKSGWSFSVGPTAALPFNSESAAESLYFAIGAATRLAYNGQSEDDVGFKILYDFGFNRNIHQFETSDTNDANTMSSLNHYVEATYAFDSPVSLTAWVGFSSAWTYLGELSNDYTLGQELGYSLSDDWETAIGHERGGNFLSPNGQAYNFSLFDAEESRFYVLVKLSI